MGLPSVNTTKPVPKPKIQVHQANRRGWVKQLDANSGRAKYLDAKIGSALDVVNGKPEISHRRF